MQYRLYCTYRIVLRYCFTRSKDPEMKRKSCKKTRDLVVPRKIRDRHWCKGGSANDPFWNKWEQKIEEDLLTRKRLRKMIHHENDKPLVLEFPRILFDRQSIKMDRFDLLGCSILLPRLCSVLILRVTIIPLRYNTVQYVSLSHTVGTVLIHVRI